MTQHQEVDIEQPARRRVVEFLPKPNSNRWTPEEDTILKDHFANTVNKRLASMLPRRTPDAIKLRGFNLGLHKAYYTRKVPALETDCINKCFLQDSPSP